ncbi:MAG: hypothetical protein LAQ69_24595 [Acidobacteriia bacterium]|nr:hypothetical protein [Terriglobia bacterium]
MTPEDLEQINAIVTAAEQRTASAIAAAIVASEQRTASAIGAAIVASEQRLIGRQERGIEAIAAEFSEMTRRFDLVDKRFDSVDRRLERVENQMHYLTLQNAGMSKSLTDAERLDTATAATLSAQQKAIDDLYHQIAELKRQRPQQQ